MKTISTFFFTLLFISLFGQTARERSVEVSAIVQEDPPQINFSWTPDPNANFYKVYKKELEGQTWGTPLTILPGSATSFEDTDIEIGQAFEYAFFKKEFDLVRDTFCIPPGTELKFAISDMYGIGLCCSFNFGFYRLEACGQVVAKGADFDFYTEDIFTVCDNGQSCTEVVLTIAPDIFPNSTSWILTDNQSGIELGTSGPVGTFIDERPKYGFIYSGIKVPAIENLGKILLLIDDEYSDPLAMEIERLKKDMIADGWQVIIRTVNKNDAVIAVKATVLEVYAQNPDLKALFILGHVPVPYSGDIYPDTHSENHQGAWSADTYYAELDGTWTDEVADITTGFFERNHNIPGDGKFDQDSIPTGKLELQYGRVDFYDMNVFALSEIELTRRYLDKDHGWRSGAIEVERRALVDDNFNVQFAAPAASGWRNFAPMFGAENIDEVDYFSTMQSNSYLWSYGCGGGSHVSADGIGTSTDFANDSLLTVFTMLFGSQFGDYDNDNNFLKAPLASGLTLTNCWVGNPPWTFHQMAMGYNIGYCARATQNTNGLYLPGPQLVHTSLMGDPTLKMHIVKAPLAFEAFQVLDSAVSFTYLPSPDPEVVGYYIYRGTDPEGSFERVSADIIEDPETFTDMPPNDGDFYYMLRAVKLETSGSGTYYNLSPGLIDSSSFILEVVAIAELALNNMIHISPNPTAGLFEVIVSQDIPGEGRITVMDIKGRVIVERSFTSGRTEGFDLSAFANGVYLVKVLTEAGFVVRKVVKE
ncbi:MAG: hypothetical protein ACI8P3_004487 [Saprospiraceae bacterium]|jgi:hypothetical protein